MARAQIKRNSFNAGEISALALGRTDLSDKYNNACESMQNFIPLIVGGATRRPGMRYICPAMGPSRLVPFIFSLTQAFVLEFGDQLLRFYTNGGQIQSSGSSYPNWGPLATWGGLGQRITPLANNPGHFSYQLTGSNHGVFTSWSVEPQPWNQTVTGPTVEGGPNGLVWINIGVTALTTPYQIATPYDTSVDDLWDLKFAQQGDLLYIVHPNHPPMKLGRVSDTSWILVAPAFRPPPLHAFDQDIGSANADHATNITLSAGAISGDGATFTALVAASSTPAPVFIAGDIGKQIISGAGVAFITAMTGAFAVDPNTGAKLYHTVMADIIDSFANTNPIPYGSWVLRGQPKAYACYGTGSANNFFLTSDFGIGATLLLFAFNTYPSGGGSASGGAFPPVDVFREIDIGRYVVMDGAVSQILSLTSAHEAKTRLLSPINLTTPLADGELRALPAIPDTWSIQDNAFGNGNGYPRATCFCQDRLVFAGTLALPQGWWMSTSGDYENFAIGANADNAISDTVNSGELETIQSVEDFQGNLAVLTYRTEYMIGGGTVQYGGVGQTLAPNNKTTIRQSKWGAASIQPIEVQGELLYVKRNSLIAGSMSFDIQTSKYRTKNLNILSELMTTSGFKEMVYQQYPFYCIWFVDLDGNLVGLTFEAEQGVWGWHRHFTGQDLWTVSPIDRFTQGQHQVPDTPPLRPDQFVSVASIPDPSIIVDQLWACCMRNVESHGPPPTDTQSYTIELFDPNLYVDSGSQALFNPAVQHVGNLGYLNGRTAVANADGAAFGPQPVAAGTYELMGYNQGKGYEAADIQVGLNFISKIVTTRVEVPFGGQTSQGIQKRWSRIWLRVYQTVGSLVDNWRLFQRTPSAPMTAGVPPFTGDVMLDGNPDYDRDGRITIIQDQPLPMTILAQFGTLSIGDN